MTAVETDAGRLKGEADEPGWEVDPDDEWGVAVIATVGRDMVCKIEGGKRIPRQDYLARADEVPGAGGPIAVTWEDVKRVRYPKKVRELAKLEGQAVEIGVYESISINGLLQSRSVARIRSAARSRPCRTP